MITSRLLKQRYTSILITLLITLQISACTTDNNVATAESTGSAGTTNTGTNHAAIITGDDRDSVTVNIAPGGTNPPGVSGKLNITDSDSGETAFIETTIEGNYGNLTIDLTGNWSYSNNNNQAVIPALINSATLTDNLIVNSIDGTPHTILITINGIDETNNPALIANIDSTSLTESIAPGGDNLPESRRKSTITDIGAGNNRAVPQSQGNDATLNSTPAVITLSWVAPAEREDNSNLSLSAIAGYKVYYGTTQGQYPNSATINDGTAAGYTFTGLPAGTYHFVVTTIDTEGRESLYSSEVTIII